MDNPYKNRSELYDQLMNQDRWFDATRLASDTPPAMHNEDISVVMRFTGIT
jgi:hypothetical protein